MTQQYHFAFMAAWFSYTVISNHDILLHVPLGLVPRANSRPHPGICSPVPTLQLPAAVISRGLASPSRVCMIAARTVSVILISIRLSQISFFTLQQPQMLLLCPKYFPRCGDLTLASVSPLPRCRCSPAHSPCTTPSPHTSFILPRSSWFYIFFSGTLACSQLVFCKILCIWKCISDVSMERDMLNIHLLLCHLVLWNTFVHLLSFYLYVSLGLKLVSYRQYIHRTCFYIHSVSPCLLVGVFNSLSLKAISDMCFILTFS